MEIWKQDRIGSCQRGENPSLLCKMKSGFAVIGDSQLLPGYCVLLASPKVSSLNELSDNDRNQFLSDMAKVGDAITAACNPLRINYAIMANYDQFLHAHIWARYTWEPEAKRLNHPWSYPPEEYRKPEYRFDQPRYRVLIDKIKHELKNNL